jgi:putative toxin-antitoxin system antitoxin component (TIGR02293 family)
MARTQTAATTPRKKIRSVTSKKLASQPQPLSVKSHLLAYIQAEKGIPKSDATLLFQRVASSSSLPTGKLRAKLIPDSSWKRSGKKLGPNASQTTIRLGNILSIAERIWGNEADATAWLNNPHPELQGATPLSLLKTEAGGRAVETLLAALEHGFPV